MKRIRNSLMIILFMFLLGVSFNVHAEEFNYYLSNSNQSYEYVDKNSTKAIDIKRGDTIKLTAVVDNKDNVTDYHINSGKLTIRWDEKYLSLQEIDGKPYNDTISDVSGLTIGSVNKGTSKLSLSEISSTGNLKAGKNKIVEFSFLVLEVAPAGETKIYQMDGEDNLKCIKLEEENPVNCGDSLYSEVKYNVLKSTVNTLSSIKVNGMELEQFNEETNSIELELDSNVEKATIDVVKKDNRASISGNYGENKLDYGLNKFKIDVTSESGVKNTYEINITRVDSRSNINTLSTLTLSAGNIKFDSDTVDYNIIVENTVDKITIKSTLTDSKSKYVEDYKEKTIELVEGSNKIEIKVLSEKGEEKTYTLNINRALSSNNSLKSLKVNDTKIELKENEFIYDITVETEVDEVIIKAETNDPKATLNLEDKYPLEVGDNEINIKVTAADGKTASYILTITRSKLPSKDSLLSSIKIKGYDIDFKQNVNTYDLKIKDSDNELEITTVQEDPNATVEIEGNKDLINGSIIKINVKAEDGSFTRYFIRIEKGSSGIPTIVIILIVLFILLAGCVGLIIYRKKKKEQEKFDQLDINDEVNESVLVNEPEVTIEENTNVEPNISNNSIDIPPIEKTVEEQNKDVE